MLLPNSESKFLPQKIVFLVYVFWLWSLTNIFTGNVIQKIWFIIVAYHYRVMVRPRSFESAYKTKLAQAYHLEQLLSFFLL